MKTSTIYLNRQSGSILTLFAVSLTMMFILLALVVDIGYVVLTKSELQNAADAAALAGAVELADESAMAVSPDQSDDIIAARDFSQSFAYHNQAAFSPIAVDRNDANASDGGVVVGYIDNPMDFNSPFETEMVSRYNSVQVTTKRAADINGPLDLFLGAFTKLNQVEVMTTATASIEDRVIGFDVESGETLDMLPFSVYVDAWDAIYDPDFVERPDCPVEFVDKYSWHDGVVYKNCADGIPEIKLYPNKEDVCGLPAAPGNFGTIDLGESNNSASDLRRQILYGINGDDLLAMGGFILTDPDDDGVFTKWVDADTGVSNTIKDAMREIIGEARILPLHCDLIGSGDGAQYELCRFIAVHVMDVKMTGALEKRHIVVQPGQIVESRAIVDPEAPHSNMIYAISLTR